MLWLRTTLYIATCMYVMLGICYFLCNRHSNWSWSLAVWTKGSEYTHCWMVSSTTSSLSRSSGVRVERSEIISRGGVSSTSSVVMETSWFSSCSGRSGRIFAVKLRGKCSQSTLEVYSTNRWRGRWSGGVWGGIVWGVLTERRRLDLREAHPTAALWNRGRQGEREAGREGERESVLLPWTSD